MIKKFNIVILISTLCIITFSSCNKESTLPIQNENQNSTNELKSLVSQVKFWNDSIVSNKTNGVDSENNIKSFSLGPDDITPPSIDWDKAFINFDSNNIKSVTIPLSMNYINGEKLQLVATKNKNSINGYLIKILPDSIYFSKQVDIYDYKNFSGSITIYNLKGVRLKKEIFKQGIVSKYAFNSKTSQSNQTTFDTEPPCYSCDLLTVVVYNTKRSSFGLFYIFNYQNIQVDGSDGSGASGAGGEGGVYVGGDETPVEPYIILNNITDPCLKKLIESLQNSNKLTNSIGAILQNVFGKNERLNLTFNQDNNLTNTNGERLNGKSIPPDNGNYEIKLNALSLSKYSQERQTLTIMHEILHSYFWAAYGNLVTPNQHTRMLNEYIEEMASSLEDLYPQLSENHDVTIALCFDNLETSVGLADKQINPIVFENAINDDKYKKIGLYLTNWKSIAEKAIYNNDMSTLGTKSPCTY
jgi:membrane-bound inhibitor of C-type lysozyme